MDYRNRLCEREVDVDVVDVLMWMLWLMWLMWMLMSVMLRLLFINILFRVGKNKCADANSKQRQQKKRRAVQRTKGAEAHSKSNVTAEEHYQNL